jgi:hypothetical protein
LNIKQQAIDWITRRLKIPSAAMRMFKAANDISGIDKNTLPTELIPLNSIQLSRGLLNFTFIQSNPGWIFPYWAVKQYDPRSPSFIPRSHMGVSMNVTHRNWTGIGTPDCNTEPVVDPAGLITIFRDGWSVDTWLKIKNKIFFPSYNEVTQELADNLPVVKTSFNLEGIKLTTTAYTSGSTLNIISAVENENHEQVNCDIIFAIRPFNPEGISLIDEIRYTPGNKSITVNNLTTIFFDKTPAQFIGRSYTEGDTASLLKDGSRRNDIVVKCNSGMATAAAVFNETIQPGKAKEFSLYVPLEKGKDIRGRSLSEQINYWEEILNNGMQVKTPENSINNLFKASVASLLMLTDKDEIMPGPFTYHQFWFRDAAYMLNALDKLGFTGHSARVISSFKNHIDNDGYFRSQKGEWDSNGQALWAIYQHFLLTGDKNIITDNFDVCLKAVKWINNKRKNNKYPGLLPAGLSAEHLGLADFYYWDNFWSLAGINAFIMMCGIINRKPERNFAENLFKDYYNIILEYINAAQVKNSGAVITAGPARGMDCGMIGSVCAVYPLQLPFDKQLALNTLDFIKENYFIDGLFYQNFIHSGLNIYLSVQLAHSYLLLGERAEFLKIMRRVTGAASPVLNFPEAIHPVTSGGVMGDGHHGWAAAEYVLAVRDAFLFETVNNNGSAEINFFGGIPPEWFMEDNEFSVVNAPSPAGIVNAGITVTGRVLDVKIECSSPTEPEQLWKIIIPVKCTPLTPGAQHISINEKNETVITIKPGSTEFSLLTGESIPHEISGALN